MVLPIVTRLEQELGEEHIVHLLLCFSNDKKSLVLPARDDCYGWYRMSMDWRFGMIEEFEELVAEIAHPWAWQTLELHLLEGDHR